MNQLPSQWIKTLSDGTNELGTDELVDAGQASWTKGRQDIVAASLSYNRITLSVSYDTQDLNCSISNWEQVDGNLYDSLSDMSRRVLRKFRIKNNGFKFLSLKDKQGVVTCFISNDERQSNCKLAGDDCISLAINENGQVYLSLKE